MTKSVAMPGMNRDSRARFGYTLTFRCLATGDVVTRRIEGLTPVWQKREVRPLDPMRARVAAAMGTLEEATKALLRHMRNKQDRVWVVQSFSSPQTIFTDLVRGKDYNPRGGPKDSFQEVGILGRLGEYDMVAPELLGASAVRTADAGRPRVQAALINQAERLRAYAERGLGS